MEWYTHPYDEPERVTLADLDDEDNEDPGKKKFGPRGPCEHPDDLEWIDRKKEREDKRRHEQDIRDEADGSSWMSRNMKPSKREKEIL